MYRFEQWRDLIQAAEDEHAVARVIRNYVQGIPPAVVAALPPECQRALESWDVQSSAITLMHCELTYGGDRATADLLHEIAHTYAAASTRIAGLAKDVRSGEGTSGGLRRTA